MRTTFDFTPYRRSTVGFDRLFDALEQGEAAPANDGYPPFDIAQEGDDRYRITLAVAGFGINDIEITAQQGQLIIAGQRAVPEDRSYIHRGIASRSFERRFALGDFVKVKSADLQDGLLSIDLFREIPDEMKPHKISIAQPARESIEHMSKDAPAAGNENAKATKAA